MIGIFRVDFSALRTPLGRNRAPISLCVFIPGSPRILPRPHSDTPDLSPRCHTCHHSSSQSPHPTHRRWPYTPHVLSHRRGPTAPSARLAMRPLPVGQLPPTAPPHSPQKSCRLRRRRRRRRLRHPPRTKRSPGQRRKGRSGTPYPHAQSPMRRVATTSGHRSCTGSAQRLLRYLGESACSGFDAEKC